MNTKNEVIATIKLQDRIIELNEYKFSIYALEMLCRLNVGESFTVIKKEDGIIFLERINHKTTIEKLAKNYPIIDPIIKEN